MRFGDTIQIDDRGFRIATARLESLGIYQSSKCWGVWLEGRNAHNIKVPEGEEKQTPQLIISSIHPDLWPISFYLQMRLRNKRGVLHSALRDISEYGATLVSVECSPSGYHQASLNAVCTFDRFRDWASLTNFSLEGARTTVDATRKAMLRTVGDHMLRALVEFWVQIRGAESLKYLPYAEHRDRGGPPGILEYERENDQELPFYLAPRVVEEGSEPWFLQLSHPSDAVEEWWSNAPDTYLSMLSPQELEATRELISGEAKDQSTREPTVAALIAKDPTRKWLVECIRDIFNRQKVEPVFLRALTPLAYFRVWAVEPYRPVTFKYEDGRLVPMEEDREEFYDVLCDPNGKRPALAIGAFNSAERFLRLKFLSRPQAEESLRVRVDYRLAAKHPPHGRVADVEEPTSKGLLAAVCGACAPSLQLLRVTNSLKGSDRNVSEGGTRQSESGVIELLATTSGRTLDEAGGGVQGDIGRAVADWKQSSGMTATVQVDVMPLPFVRVFVSHSFSAHRSEDTKNMLVESLQEEGLQAEFWERYDTPVTPGVTDVIRQCDAFLQILQSVGDDSDIEANRPWLQFEYGVAFGLGKPRVRILDLAIPENQRGKLVATDRDTPQLEYSSKWDRGEIARKFTEAAKTLALGVETKSGRRL